MRKLKPLSHSKALTFSKKKPGFAHFPRPAETDPYMLGGSYWSDQSWFLQFIFVVSYPNFYTYQPNMYLYSDLNTNLCPNFHGKKYLKNLF